jgi:hypothetical protein
MPHKEEWQEEEENRLLRLIMEGFQRSDPVRAMYYIATYKEAKCFVDVVLHDNSDPAPPPDAADGMLLDDTESDEDSDVAMVDSYPVTDTALVFPEGEPLHLKELESLKSTVLKPGTPRYNELLHETKVFFRDVMRALYLEEPVSLLPVPGCPPLHAWGLDCESHARSCARPSLVASWRRRVWCRHCKTLCELRASRSR